MLLETDKMYVVALRRFAMFGESERERERVPFRFVTYSSITLRMMPLLRAESITADKMDCNTPAT